MEKINLTKKLAALFFVALFAAGSFMFKSCELEDSMMCRKATYVDGVLDSATEWEKYSGLRLEEILDEEDVTIGNRTTRWECK
ncbi:MAG: hypothetical protein EA408_05195 [Marinilabiliales bacterium]|nr:MAG: hypothetical protein EA408_05195 [Marinilabiliales bacterium]